MHYVVFHGIQYNEIVADPHDYNCNLHVSLKFTVCASFSSTHSVLVMHCCTCPICRLPHWWLYLVACVPGIIIITSATSVWIFVGLRRL